MAAIESAQGQAVEYNNQGYNNPTVLQIRLDADIIVDKIELFLRGARYVVKEDKDGRTITERVPIGEPKANDLGVQSVLNKITTIVNSQTVQGNFTIEQYDQYIEEINIDLVSELVENCVNWEILDEDIEVICNFIMSLTIPFISRLVDNKERESYGETIKTVESNRVESSGGFKLFNRGEQR